MTGQDVSCRFLDAVKCALCGRQVQWDGRLDANGWRELYFTARNHSLLPVVAEAVYDCMERDRCAAADLKMDKTISRIKSRARITVVRQAERTAEFLCFYEYLASRGLRPLVVKGIICRNLYPQPEQRPSVDEDLLIDPAQFRLYHDAITEYGLVMTDPEQDIDSADEVAYHTAGNNDFYIEVHKTLFSARSEAYGYLNDFFADVLERADKTETSEIIYGTRIWTLEPTDHLRYLILHAFKHFLHSGFGIRQVCDIILFSERYRDQINWDALHSQLTGCRAFDFTRAIYCIGEKYLLPEHHLKEYLQDWDVEGIDERPLLQDIMDGGLYGGVTQTRLHSSNMTLHAAAASSAGRVGETARTGRKNGRRGRSGQSGGAALLHTVFLPLESMRGRYTFLNKAPLLLPLAWGMRIISYLAETRKSRKGKRRNKAEEGMLEAVRIGKERIRLLEMYHIIE